MRLFRLLNPKLLPHSSTPNTDLELILLEILPGKNRAFLYSHQEYQLNDAEKQNWLSLFKQRRNGVPIAYILKRRGFWQHDFKVTPATLIPRSETELLIELALKLALPKKAMVADLGTGSGVIALSLAVEHPTWQIIAVDHSAAALSVAVQNAQLLQVKNVEFREGSWCNALLPLKFDLIVSNPPYLAASDPHLQKGDLRFEPQVALVSGPTGLEDLSTIVSTAPHYLKPGGFLLLEHGYNQQKAVCELLKATTKFIQIATYQDLAGIQRAVCAQLK